MTATNRTISTQRLIALLNERINICYNAIKQNNNFKTLYEFDDLMFVIIDELEFLKTQIQVKGGNKSNVKPTTL